MFITVRTKTKEGNVSADSKVVRVPRSGNGITNEREGVIIMQNNSSLPYYTSGRIIGEFVFLQMLDIVIPLRAVQD